jgi:hypothetical protein
MNKVAKIFVAKKGINASMIHGIHNFIIEGLATHHRHDSNLQSGLRRVHKLTEIYKLYCPNSKKQWCSP